MRWLNLPDSYVSVAVISLFGPALTVSYLFSRLAPYNVKGYLGCIGCKKICRHCANRTPIMASIHSTTTTRVIPKHSGPYILPNFTLFNRLLRLACKETKYVIKDVPHNINATHLQLITDVLSIRNHLLSNLSGEVLESLSRNKEVYINLLAPGGYEYVTAFLAIVAIGAVVVPICKQQYYMVCHYASMVIFRFYRYEPTSLRGIVLCEKGARRCCYALSVMFAERAGARTASPLEWKHIFPSHTYTSLDSQRSCRQKKPQH